MRAGLLVGAQQVCPLMLGRWQLLKRPQPLLLLRVGVQATSMQKPSGPGIKYGYASPGRVLLAAVMLGRSGAPPILKGCSRGEVGDLKAHEARDRRR